MEEVQTANGILKLIGKPQPVELLVDGSRFKCWMHPLKSGEILDVEAVGLEAYRNFKGRGASKEDAAYKSSRVNQCQHLFYSLKKTDELHAERLFTEAEMSIVDFDEVQRLIKLYEDFFVPTKDEIKNCLRERLGIGSEILSISPKDSAEKSSSPMESSTLTPTL